MYIALVVVHVLVAVGLVLIVLLQTGRGAELGAAFGGLGQATYMRGQYTFIHKVTTTLAVIFMSTSLTLAFISIERPTTSLLAPGAAASSAPAAPTPAAVPAPGGGAGTSAASPATPQPEAQQPAAPAK